MTDLRAVLHTDLPVDEVRRRLAATLQGDRGLSGRVGPRRVRLVRRQRLHNPFHVSMRAKFAEAPGGGARLDCVATIGAWGRSLLVLVTVVLLGVLLSVYAETGSRATFWIGAVIGSAGVGLVYALGRHVSRHEPDALLQLLVTTLDARVVEESRRG